MTRILAGALLIAALPAGFALIAPSAGVGSANPQDEERFSRSAPLLDVRIAGVQPLPDRSIDLVYKVPGSGPDGRVSIGSRDAETGEVLGVDRTLGSFTTGRVASVPGGRQGVEAPVVLVSASGLVQRHDFGGGTPVPGRSVTGAVDPVVVGADGYVYQVASGMVSSATKSGRPVATYPVPAPREGPRPAAVAVVQGRTVRIGSLASDPEGRIFAFADDSVNALVYEIHSAARIELPKLGSILGATIGANGHAFVLAFNEGDRRQEYIVTEVDLQRGRVIGQASTGITPNNGSIDDMPSILTGASGDLWVYVSQHDPGSEERRSVLLRVTSGSLTVDTVAIPNNAGSRMALGPTGDLYFFSGIARDVVHRFEPTTRTFSTLPARAPQGSFILALSVR